MKWQPTLSWQNAQKRSEVLYQVREFFRQRKVVEVETQRYHEARLPIFISIR